MTHASFATMLPFITAFLRPHFTHHFCVEANICGMAEHLLWTKGPATRIGRQWAKKNETGHLRQGHSEGDLAATTPPQ